MMQSNSSSQQQQHKDKRPLDPLITIQVALDEHAGSKTPLGTASSRTTIASVCFLPSSSSSRDILDIHANQQDNEADDDDDDEDDSSSSSDDDDSGEFQLRCHQILQGESTSRRDPTTKARQMAATMTSLGGRYLASCHANGEVSLWDLASRQSIDDHFIENRGPGWMLRRIEGTQQMLYQTRDPMGTVSLHDLFGGRATTTGSSNQKIVTSFETYSQTFCSAAPCTGNPNLLALPSEGESDVTIRDLRVDPVSLPVAVFPGAGQQAEGEERKHGMLTSLAFSKSLLSTDGMDSISSRPVVASGMESGEVFFHDLAMLGKALPPPSFKLANDPVLALDMAPSKPRGVVAVAGMAGEAGEIKELPTEEQGTVALLKATFHEEQLQDDNNVPSMKVRLRSRLHTCQPTGDGKPGVNLIRFQPGEGRFFAVGGWDKRLRIMDRAAQSKKSGRGALLAILRGHHESVKAMDWAPDSAQSGLLATAAGDGKIHVWKCFSKS